MVDSRHMLHLLISDHVIQNGTSELRILLRSMYQGANYNILFLVHTTVPGIPTRYILSSSNYSTKTGKPWFQVQYAVLLPKLGAAIYLILMLTCEREMLTPLHDKCQGKHRNWEGRGPYVWDPGSRLIRINTHKKGPRVGKSRRLKQAIVQTKTKQKTNAHIKQRAKASKYPGNLKQNKQICEHATRRK